MPRHTLPQSVASLKTMEVFLTKTTEEQIWDNLEKQMVGLEEKIEEYYDTLNDLTKIYIYTNPYDKYSIQDWRNQKPKLKYKYDKMRWLSENGEQYLAEYLRIIDIKHDIRKCNRAFPEWEEKLNQIIFYMDKYTPNTEELLYYETEKYQEAKKRYEEADAEYIKEHKKIFDHREFHITREKFKINDFSRNVICCGVEPEYWTTCKWCVEDERRLKDIKEAEVEQDRIIQEDMKRYEAEQQKKRAEKNKDIEYHICECCEYKTSNPDIYDRHLDSKEHKIKQNHTDWFCKCCNTQSRSKNEHEFHLKSSKHQKNMNGDLRGKPDIFRCECCSYDTPRKDLYNRHLLSKSHIKLANSSE